MSGYDKIKRDSRSWVEEGRKEGCRLGDEGSLANAQDYCRHMRWRSTWHVHHILLSLQRYLFYSYSLATSVFRSRRNLTPKSMPRRALALPSLLSFILPSWHFRNAQRRWISLSRLHIRHCPSRYIAKEWGLYVVSYLTLPCVLPNSSSISYSTQNSQVHIPMDSDCTIPTYVISRNDLAWKDSVGGFSLGWHEATLTISSQKCWCETAGT